MSKKENILLQKSELGKNKLGFHDLPQSEHVYGKAPTKDQYGAREGNPSAMQLSPAGSSTQSPMSKSLRKTSLP
jgi:hypothetical protein